MTKVAMFENLWAEAHKAGDVAAKAAIPVPMIVRETIGMTGVPTDKSWLVSEGPCGFAWVNVKPGNSAFAKWLVSKKLAHKDSYEGGVKIWVHDYGQSITRKEAYAYAVAKFLREKLGTSKIYSGSRMD